MSLPPFVARLIGIGKYDEYPHLQPEGDTNAKSLEKFLRGDPTLNRDIDVKTIIENVTRDNIIEIFDELGNSIDRNKAILIFFSGYGGRTVAGRRLSIICPADIGASDKSKGITDQELVHYFDGISRFRGNNITFLLDCPSSEFKWGNPSSFVVIAPRTVPPDNRGAFTKSIIRVLRSERDSLAFLTVHSFAAKIHAAMPGGIEVDCHGQNVDRLLFNPRKGKAHHAFVPGRAETDGTLTLFAGRAHGVTEGSTFGIYTHHIAHHQSPIGHLQVERVRDSTTSKLHLPNSHDFNVPPVFYAVATRCPHEIVDVSKPDDVNIQSSRTWKETEEAKANITLERNSNSDEVNVFWNGFADPGIRIPKPGPGNCLSLPADELAKVIRHAAQFKYVVGSLANTLSQTPLFEVEFQEFDEVTEQPTGCNLLVKDKGNLVELKLNIKDNGEPMYCHEPMYCLVLRNLAKFEIWPFVFKCDPRDFKIEPWYTPTQPLAPEGKLTIGGGGEGSLMFEQWEPDPGPALTYLKIFVTKARTSFSFLTQDRSSTEDKFREVGKEATASCNRNDSKSPQSPANLALPYSRPERRRSEREDSSWQAMQITVKCTYEEEKSLSLSSSNNGLSRFQTRSPLLSRARLPGRTSNSDSDCLIS